MKKEEYLKQCGANNVNDLSDKQLLSYFLNGNGGYNNRSSAITVEACCFGMQKGDKDYKKAISLFREAFENGKTVDIQYIEGEGVVGFGRIGEPHFEMKLI